MTERSKCLARLAPACLALCLGCSNGGDGDGNTMPLRDFLCTHEVVPGITIEVRDAKTGLPAACGAEATIRDGAYIETLSDFAECTRHPAEVMMLYGAYERAGTYDVLITKPGYKDWTQDAVVVTWDQCHVDRVELEANLEQP